MKVRELIKYGYNKTYMYYISENILASIIAMFLSPSIIIENCYFLLILVYIYIFFQRPNKVRKRAKIRNRYNQAPHLTQDTNGNVTTSQLDFTNESQEVSPFPAGDHKASLNRHTQKHNKNNNKTEITYMIHKTLIWLLSRLNREITV